VLLPICGMLIGHIRFHKVRYVVVGLFMGWAAGMLLLILFLLPLDVVPRLVISLGIVTVGVLACGVYIRMR